jgi:hypothetical protein
MSTIRSVKSSSGGAGVLAIAVPPSCCAAIQSFTGSPVQSGSWRRTLEEGLEVIQQ